VIIPGLVLATTIPFGGAVFSVNQLVSHRRSIQKVMELIGIFECQDEKHSIHGIDFNCRPRPGCLMIERVDRE
jgi:hypothetical protein